MKLPLVLWRGIVMLTPAYSDEIQKWAQNALCLLAGFWRWRSGNRLLISGATEEIRTPDEGFKPVAGIFAWMPGSLLHLHSVIG
jgi:hypothetical protein